MNCFTNKFKLENTKLKSIVVDLTVSCNTANKKIFQTILENLPTEILRKVSQRSIQDVTGSQKRLHQNISLKTYFSLYSIKISIIRP
jgi:hypothetical protein